MVVAHALLLVLVAQCQPGWDDPAEVHVTRCSKLIDGVGFCAADNFAVRVFRNFADCSSPPETRIRQSPVADPPCRQENVKRSNQLVDQVPLLQNILRATAVVWKRPGRIDTEMSINHRQHTVRAIGI